MLYRRRSSDFSTADCRGLRARLGKVGTGFPKKDALHEELRADPDSNETGSALDHRRRSLSKAGQVLGRRVGAAFPSNLGITRYSALLAADSHARSGHLPEASAGEPKGQATPCATGRRNTEYGATLVILESSIYLNSTCGGGNKNGKRDSVAAIRPAPASLSRRSRILPSPRSWRPASNGHWRFEPDRRPQCRPGAPR